ncbi:MAG: hypothetical protein L3K03_03190 [Thermoplasmata archaeon]|nr:hypothetical protein [Thermoplasmata archaeon]
MVFGGGLFSPAQLVAPGTHLPLSGAGPREAAELPVHPPNPGTSSELFFQNNSTVANATFNSTNEVCDYAYQGSCSKYIEESTSPNLLSLPDGDVGMTYDVIVNTSQIICNYSINESVSHVAFASSPDGGTNWGPPEYLGDTNATCPYNEELEPSFATNRSGSILGVYVGANASLLNFGNATFVPSPPYAPTLAPNPIEAYTNRTSDALVFVNSSDSGSSFSPGRIIVSGANIARPAVAAFGRTIYVVYENIHNGTIPLPGSRALVIPGVALVATTDYPISVDLVISRDGGLTWSTPTVLPGENASENDTSMSPSISVSSTGEVAVAYVTNRSCLANCSVIQWYSSFGDDVVAATSANNGSSWALRTIFRATGEPVQGWCQVPPPQCFRGSYVYDDNPGGFYSQEIGLTALFQYAPPTSVAWNTTGADLFVAWGGSSNQSRVFGQQCGQVYFYAYQGLYTAVSSDGGASWSWQQLGYTGGSPGGGGVCLGSGLDFPLNFYNLGLTVSNGTEFLAYQTGNLSNPGGPGDEALCGFSVFDGYDQSTIEWLRQSPDGTQWSSPLPVVIQDVPQNPTQFLLPYLAYSSAILIQNGTPIVATSLPMACYEIPSVFGNFCGTEFPQSVTDFSHLEVAFVAHPPTISVTVDEIGLPRGADWSAEISGNSFTQTTSSFTALAPSGTPFFVEPEDSVEWAGQEYFSYLSGGVYNLSANGSLTVGYTTVQPFDLQLEPSVDLGLSLGISDSTFGFGYYSISNWYYNFGTGSWYSFTPQGCPMPWYLPTGFVLNVTNSDAVDANLSVTSIETPTYWAGSSNVSYTGAGANYSVTMNGPINETMWTLPFGYYGVGVSAPNLSPSSDFSFDWNGVPQSSAPGGGTLTVPNVATGVDQISNIRGSSSMPGWVYIGSAPHGGTVVVPQQTQVNLTFAFVDVGAPVGVVTFYAANLTNGTDWALTLNGTTYSSTNPWINVTTHSGTYSISAGAAVSTNGAIGYAARDVGPKISLTTGSTVPVDYSPAFKVALFASTGGRVDPNGVQWYLPGAVTPPLEAIPDPGYEFLGWSGTGLGSYNGTAALPSLTVGGPILETANFAPLPTDRFDLNFTQLGIQSGVSWQVDVGGTPYSATGPQLVVPDLNESPAQYSFTVPSVYGTDPTNATRYVPETSSGVVVAGTNYNNSLVFQTQHYLTLGSGSTGAATAQVDSVTGGSTWFTVGASVSLLATPEPGYTFAAWVGTGPGSYSGANASEPIAPSGSITELATFVPLVTGGPPPTYGVVFEIARPVATGTVWTVKIGSQTYVSTGNALNVTGFSTGILTATIPVAYAPDGSTQYSPQNGSVAVHVTASTAPIEVTFLPSYWVDVTAVGPGTVSTGSQWAPAGERLSLGATPSSTATLLSWAGTGPGAYSGDAMAANLTVDGPITEVATFAAATTAVSPATPSFLTSDAAVAILAVLGLALGATIAWVAWRVDRRRPPEAGESSSEWDPEAPSVEWGPTDPPVHSTAAMCRTSSPGVPRHFLPNPAVGAAMAIAALMILGGLPGLSLAESPGVGTPSAPSTSHTHPSVLPFSPPASAPSSGNGTFWLNSPLPNVTDDDVCMGLDWATTPYGPLCGATNITNEPSLNLSSNGVLVTAYTAYTNWTPCEAEYPWLGNYTFSQIGIATSVNGGASWSSPQYLGNTVCTNATLADDYVNAWQPSVTSLANGTLVVAFVEFNLSLQTGCGSCYLVYPDISASDRTGDANGGNGPNNDFNASQLVVAFSYDNGVAWTAPTPVNTSTIGGSWCPTGCLASANWIQQRPSLTASGQTIYLTWTNITEGWVGSYAPVYCTFFGPYYCGSGDSAVQLAVSPDGTADFGPPIQLPVVVAPRDIPLFDASGYPLTPTQYYVAANPSTLVTPNGTLVVAYMTNLSWNMSLGNQQEGTRQCSVSDPLWDFSSCGGFLSDVVVAQSSDNGSEWTTGVAARSVFDGRDYAPNYAAGPTSVGLQDVQDYVNDGDQLLPAPKATYDPASQQIVLAFTADLGFTNCLPSFLYIPCQNFSTPDIWVANGSLVNNSWTSRLVTTWSALANSTPNGVQDSYFYNPAIASSSDGTIYVTAQFVNGSACTVVPSGSYLGLNTFQLPNSAGIVPEFPYCGEGFELYGTSTNNGTTFSSPNAIDTTGSWFEEMPPGVSASMISAGDAVWVAWTQTTCPGWNGSQPFRCSVDDTFSYPSPIGGFTSTTTAIVSRLFVGTGLTVSFDETGLPIGTPWSVDFSQAERSGLAGGLLSVSGVPSGANESWAAPLVEYGAGIRYSGTPSVASPGNFSTSTTIDWTFVEQFALTVTSIPEYPNSSVSQLWFEGTPYTFCPVASIAFDPNGLCNFYATTINYNLTPSPGVRWYDVGSHVPIQAIPLNGSQFWCAYAGFGGGCYLNYANLTFQVWTGSGAGSYNGTANQTMVTMDGPVTETATFDLNGYCGWSSPGGPLGAVWSSICVPNSLAVEFRETGLPAAVRWGVSVWGSGPDQATPYPAFTNASTLSVLDPDLGSLVDFQAFTVPSSVAGQVWVPTPNPASPLLGPAGGASTIQYSLRAVNSTPFDSSVRAVGLPNGTAWSFSLDGVGTGVNGTTANLTLTGGSHTLSAEPVYFSNGTGYVATSIDVDPFVMNESWTNVTAASATYTFDGATSILVQFTPVEELTAQASAGGSITPAGTRWVEPGGTVTLVASADSGYQFVGWTASSLWGVNASTPEINVTLYGPTFEFATFAPNRTAAFVVTVTATGLIAGGTYAVVFNGTTYVGSGTFALPAYGSGNYLISIPIAYDNASSLVRFLPVGFTTTGLPSGPGGTYVLGSDGAEINVEFDTQYALQVGSSGSGTVTPSAGEYWETAGNQTLLTATPAPGNLFAGWSGTGNGSANSNRTELTVTIVSPIVEAAQFVPYVPPARPTFTLAVTETGLPSGTPWGLSDGGTGSVSTTPTISVGGLNGTYTVSVAPVRIDAGDQFASNLTLRSFTVDSNTFLNVSFTGQYRLIVLAGAGGSATPGTGWVDLGSSVSLDATPESGFHFVEWIGSGDVGNFSGTTSMGTVTMNGAINETAEFAPNSGPAVPASGATSLLPAYVPWVALLVLLAVGFLTVYVIGRRQRDESSPSHSEKAVEHDADPTSEPSVETRPER